MHVQSDVIQGTLDFVLGNANHERLKKSMAVYHGWRTLVLQVQKDASGPKILDEQQERDFNTVFREAADYCKITDLLKYVLVDGPAQPNVIVRTKEAKRLSKLFEGHFSFLFCCVVVKRLFDGGMRMHSKMFCLCFKYVLTRQGSSCSGG